MTIEWDPSWEVGIEIVDTQHQELVGQIAVLLGALHESRGEQVGTDKPMGEHLRLRGVR